MIGLDSNVIIRHLVADNGAEAERVRKFLARRCTVEHPGYLNRIVLCEVVWVLKRLYRYDRAVIADVIDRLLHTAELTVEDRGLALEALEAYRRSKVDFADCLVGLTNRAAGCEATATLDRAAAGLPTFRAI
jgi:predicted nucleic-acid-binding protein